MCFEWELDHWYPKNFHFDSLSTSRRHSFWMVDDSCIRAAAGGMTIGESLAGHAMVIQRLVPRLIKGL